MWGSLWKWALPLAPYYGAHWVLLEQPLLWGSTGRPAWRVKHRCTPTNTDQWPEGQRISGTFTSAGKWRLKLVCNDLDNPRPTFLESQSFGILLDCLINHSLLYLTETPKINKVLACSLALSLQWLVTVFAVAMLFS